MDLTPHYISLHNNCVRMKPSEGVKWHSKITQKAKSMIFALYSRNNACWVVRFSVTKRWYHLMWTLVCVDRLKATMMKWGTMSLSMLTAVSWRSSLNRLVFYLACKKAVSFVQYEIHVYWILTYSQGNRCYQSWNSGDDWAFLFLAFLARSVVLGIQSTWLHLRESTSIAFSRFLVRYSLLCQDSFNTFNKHWFWLALQYIVMYLAFLVLMTVKGYLKLWRIARICSTENIYAVSIDHHHVLLMHPFWSGTEIWKISRSKYLGFHSLSVRHWGSCLWTVLRHVHAMHVISMPALQPH